MTDITLSLFLCLVGALMLGLRFVRRPWSYALLPLFGATMVLAFARAAFRFHLMAPVGELADMALAAAGFAMLATGPILDWRARARARQAGSQPQ